MNAWPTLGDWLQFAGTLALELVIVFVVAKLVTLRLRSVSWRRAVWQMTVVAVLLVAMGEMNGVRGWLSMPEQSAQIGTQKKVIVTFKDVEPDITLFNESDFTASAPENAAPVPSLSRWRQHVFWPALVWITVSALLVARLLFAQVLALAVRLFGRRVADQTTHAKALRLAGVLGIHSRFVLRTSARVVAPFTFGVWRPLIVLPNNFTAAFTSEQQDVALAHELAHVAGLDSAWRGFSQFVCALLWWHPLVWLAKRELDHASELVADESSLLVADGPDRLAECLLACARQLRRPALAGWLGMDGGGFRSALGKRVARLLQLQPQSEVARRVPWYLRLVAPLLCTALVLIGATPLTKPGTGNGGTWGRSILGSALAAAAENKAPAVLQNQPETEALKPEVARLIHDGKLFYETGQLEAAQTNLQAALRIDPKSQGAAYYLNLVQAGQALAARSVETGLPVATNSPAPTDPRRQAIYEKLRTIHFLEFGPIDNLPLSEVLRALNDDMRRRDPEHKGINLMFNGAPSQPNEMDATGLPVTPVDLGSTAIRLSTKLRDISCEEILNIIAITADRPIQYTVETYAVVFTPKSKSQLPLHTRFFRIDPVTFQQSLNSMQPPVSGKQKARSPERAGEPPTRAGARRGQTNQTNGGISSLTEVVPAASVIPAVRKWFASMGVDLSVPEKAVFYNDRLGVLMVRATLEDLDTIEKAMQVLNMSPPQLANTNTTSVGKNSVMPSMLNMSPPQLTIRVKVMEVERRSGDKNGDLFLGSFPAITNVTATQPRLADSLTVEGMRNVAAQPATVTGILTDAQFRSVIKGLEQRGGTDLLSAPEITTVSGRQAQIKVVDIKYIVTDLDITEKNPKKDAAAERRKEFEKLLEPGKRDATAQPQVTNDGSVIQPIAEPFELGPVVDIVPWVQPDGRTIQMTVIPSLKEFLGYDDPGAFVASVPDGKTNQLTSPVPLPKFRLRKVQTSAAVLDGQTLVIGAGSARHLVQKTNPDGTTTNTFVEKELFYFITPSLIDSAGNLTHPR